MPHFHILWSNSLLDWEPFDSQEEARRGAEVLVRLGETYTIEEFDDDCPRCRQFAVKYHEQTEPEPKYPWQKLVFEALREKDAVKLAGKINAAEQAIAQRLSLQTFEGLDEQAAIRDALRVLRVLIDERHPPNLKKRKKQRNLDMAVQNLAFHKKLAAMASTLAMKASKSCSVSSFPSSKYTR